MRRHNGHSISSGDVRTRPNTCDGRRPAPGRHPAGAQSSLGNMQRAMSAGRLSAPRPTLITEGRPDMVILDPLPPPREEAGEDEVDRSERLQLLEARLRLMDVGTQPDSAPLGSLPDLRLRRKNRRSMPDTQLPRSRRQSPDKSKLEQAYSGTWGELNPHDAVQNPKAHFLLQSRRAASDSPQRQRRSESKGSFSEGVDQHIIHDLESFRPSFRTEWLVALRRELLLGTRQENAKLRREFDKIINAAVHELKTSYDDAVGLVRKDYADAAADIRHDFIDCFINGDISGMIEAASVKKRAVEVDFRPVFEEIDKLKQHVNASESEVLAAISTMRKDQSNLREETARLVIDLTDSVSNDIRQSVSAIEDIRVQTSKLAEEAGSGGHLDLSPVLEAIGRVDVHPDVDLLRGAVEAVKDHLGATEKTLQTDMKNLEDTLNSARHADLENTSQEMKLDNMVLLNAFVGTGLQIGELLGEQLDSLKDLGRIGEVSMQSLSKQGDDLRKIHDIITSSSNRIEAAVKAASEAAEAAVEKERSPVLVDLSPVLDAVAKIDLGTVITTVITQVDAHHTETCNLIKDPANIQPVLKAVHALDFSVDLSPVLDSTGQVLSMVSQLEGRQGNLEAQQGNVQTLLKETHAIAGRTEASIPPPVDMAPLLQAITAIDVQPQVNIDLQSVLDAVASVSRDASAHKADLLEASKSLHADTDKLVGSIAKLDSATEKCSQAITDDLTSLRLCLREDLRENKDEVKSHTRKISNETVASILGVTTVAFAQTSVSLRELLESVCAIKMPDLDRVLHAFSAIDFSPVTKHIDTARSESLSAVKNASLDLKAVLQAIADSDVALERGLNAMQRLDSETKSNVKTVHDLVVGIDARPLVDLGPLHDLAAAIDAKLPADLQPVLDAVAAIEVKPVIKVDTRPVIDTMQAGLARIEIAWAQVDLREVTSMLKKIDARLLEAHVKIDAKDPTRSHNFIWASEAAKWT